MTLAAREDGAAFADVVYADQDWVDAEFAELIAASFGGPPAPPPPAPPPSRQHAPGPAVVLFPPAGPARTRQRSPPARPRIARPATAPSR
jgi:hypothetical protein